jgi:MFS family permease
MWVSQLVSLTGTQMQVVAINWHIYLLTRSALALGFVGLTRVVPVIVFSLWGGIVADRRDRRVVMFATQSAMAAVSVALVFLALRGHAAVWPIYALNALQAAAAAFDSPARQALIPRLVSREDLPGALALNLTMFHAAMIGGPGVAGVLIAALGGSTPVARGPGLVDTRALALLYALNAISFAGILFVLVIMRTSGRVDPSGVTLESPMESLRAGLRFVFTTPVMVWTMALDFFATFFSGAMSLLPIVADQILHVGPQGYGWLVAAPAAGAVLGSIYTSVHPLPRRQGKVLLWAVVAYGVATIVYGFSRSFVLTLVALAATGLADVVSTVIRQTLRQLLTPDALRGRMTSVNMIFFMGGPQLGEMEAGLLASAFASAAVGITVSIVSGGLATLAAAAVVAGATTVVRRYEPPLSGSGG